MSKPPPPSYSPPSIKNTRSDRRDRRAANVPQHVRSGLLTRFRCTRIRIVSLLMLVGLILLVLLLPNGWRENLSSLGLADLLGLGSTQLESNVPGPTPALAQTQTAAGGASFQTGASSLLHCPNPDATLVDNLFNPSNCSASNIYLRKMSGITFGVQLMTIVAAMEQAMFTAHAFVADFDELAHHFCDTEYGYECFFLPWYVMYCGCFSTVFLASLYSIRTPFIHLMSGEHAQ